MHKSSQYNLSSMVFLRSQNSVRVTTNMENLEKLGYFTLVREKSGELWCATAVAIVTK